MHSVVSAFSKMFRSLGRSPSYALVVVLTLGAAIGANTAIFTLVDAVLIRPLPYPESGRLVGVWHTAPGAGIEEFEQANGTYLVYRERNRFLEEMGIYAAATANLAGPGAPEEVPSARITPSILSVLGISPQLGRSFTEEEERPGAEPVVILSHELWSRRFGANPAFLGTTIPIDGTPRTVVGVMPPGFRFPERDTRLWLPLAIDPARADNGNFSYRGIARLKPGATTAAAAADLSGLVRRLPDLIADVHMGAAQIEDIGMAALVRPLHEDVVGEIAGALQVLLGSVGAILLVACANVANLFLIRAEGRHRELAVRSALGASRRSLILGFLGESTFLAVAAGAVGLLLASLGLDLIRVLEAHDIPRLDEVAIDSRAVLFTLAVSLLTGLLFGSIPALRALPDLCAALKESARLTAGRRRHHARRILVVAQIALALVLLTGAALMLKSFRGLIRIDPGFEASSVLTMYLYPPAAEYAGADDIARYSDRILERVRALPGVRAAGTADHLPLADAAQVNTHVFEDFPQAPGQLPPFHPILRVSAGYVETMGIPLVAGRSFEPADVDAPHGAVLVSESLARHYWPGESAVGKRLRPETTLPGRWHTVVGVVGDTRGGELEQPPDQSVYYPLRSRATADGRDVRELHGLSLVVATDVAPASLAGAVRDAVRSVDPDVSVARVRTMGEVVAEATARAAFLTLLLLLAATMAVGLGAVGLYGAISYVVSERTREFGVRIALGADRGTINRLVLGQGIGLAFVGIALGVYGGLVLTRHMESILFGVSPADPVIFVTAAVVVLLIALLSSYLPAQRAARVEPLIALRDE